MSSLGHRRKPYGVSLFISEKLLCRWIFFFLVGLFPLKTSKHACTLDLCKYRKMCVKFLVAFGVHTSSYILPYMIDCRISYCQLRANNVFGVIHLIICCKVSRSVKERQNDVKSIKKWISNSKKGQIDSFPFFNVYCGVRNILLLL
jgi:hypothetical protein